MSYVGNTPTNQAFTPAVDFFNGNGSTTAFTLSRPVASVAQVQAVISNVPQKPGDAFTVSGNTITFTSAPPSGTQNIYVYYTSPITQVIAPGQGTVAPTSLSQGGPSWDTNGNLLVGMSSYGVTNAGASLSPTASSSFYVAGGPAVTIGRGVSNGTAVQFNRSGTNVGTIDVATTGLTMTGTNGITFTAAQSASSDANTLDDYEEGTWTPTLIGATFTYSVQAGRYIKIGSFVLVQAVIATGYASATGSFYINNLPFTVINDSNIRGGVATINCQYGVTFNGFVTGEPINNSTSMYFENNISNSNRQDMGSSNFASGGFCVRVSMVYQVA